MRIFRCYHPESIEACQQLTLSPEASHHLAVVLRVKLGQVIEVFDGTGAAYQAEIVGIAKRVSVRIRATLTSTSESPLYLHLVQALSKSDKIDWVIQKAVELGVSEISLLLTERTEIRMPEDRWAKKMAHWHGIMIHAVQQSGRVKVPKLNPPMSLESFLAQASHEDIKLFLHVQGAKRPTDVLPSTFSRAQVIIGPEGGFSDAELNLAERAGCQVLSLGPRVLRTETAPLAILSVLQWLQGDFATKTI